MNKKYIKLFFLVGGGLMLFAAIMVMLETSYQNPEEKELVEKAKTFINENEEIDSIFGGVTRISMASLEINMRAGILGGSVRERTPGRSWATFYVKGNKTRGKVEVEFKKDESDQWKIVDYGSESF